MSNKFDGIITANPTWLGRVFWRLYVKTAMHLVFRSMVVNPKPDFPQSRSVLLIGNHVSWWDGFWALRLNQRCIGKNYYVMMLETQLQNRKFMRQGGAFSIAPGKRSMVTTFQYTIELLENPDNLVVMYPQGMIHSLYEDEINFQPGICKILDRVGEATQVVFYAVHVDFMDRPRPYLHFRVEPYSYQVGTDISTFNQAYQAFFDRALAEHMEQNRV